MLDTQRALVTDLGHAYRNEPDVIMTEIREEIRSAGPGNELTRGAAWGGGL